MQREDAIQKAQAVAREKQWNLDDFKAPTAELKDLGWLVRFEGRKPLPGNHFVVQIDDATGEATLWPGR